jgi:GT2 family glycosyltransferase
LPNPGAKPFVSVVIPVLARYDQLERALDRLAGQTCEHDRFEVIVVSDATEEAPERIREVVAAVPLETRHLIASMPGAAAAREDGWRDARGEVVLFLDSDVLADPGLVGEHIRWHERNPEVEVAVLGPLRWARSVRVTGFMRWVERFQFNYHTIAGEDAGWGNYITANVSSKRAMLERVDGFDVERFPFLYEDTDLAYRMSRAGMRVRFNRAASAEHLHAFTLDRYRQRVAEIAPAERRFVAAHPELDPYFHTIFVDALEAPKARGVFGRLLGAFSPGTPLIGARIWRSADAYYRQQLAPCFLDSWAKAETV